MANDKTVDLVLQAKNNVSKPVKEVIDSVASLKTKLESVAKSLDTADGGAGGFAKALADLGKQASGLQVLDKIAAALKDVGTNADTLDEGIRRGTAAIAEQTQKISAAQAELTGYKSQLDSLKTSNKDAADRQRELTKQLSDAQKEYDRATKAAERFSKANDQRQKKTSYVGTDIGAPQTNARQSAAAMEAGFAEQASARVAALSRELNITQTEVADTAKEIGLLEPKVKATEGSIREMESANQKLASGLDKTQKQLADVTTEFESLVAAEQQVLALTGRQVASADQIANAYKQTANEIERVSRLSAAMSKFSTGAGGFTDPKSAAALQKQNALIQQAESDWKALEAEAARLSGALKSVSGNATEQVDAFNRTIAAARVAKAEFNNQVTALVKLENSLGVVNSAYVGSARGSKAYAAAIGQAAVATSKMASVANAAPIKAQSDVFAKSGAAARAAAAGTNTFAAALRTLTGDTRQSLSLIQRIRGEVIALTTAYVGLQGAASQIGGVVSAFQTLEAIQSRLAVAFGDSPQRVGAELRYLETQSQRLGISFETLATEYSKFAVSAQTANFTSQATRDTFMAVAEAGRVQRLSVEQLQGIFKALGQIMDKGTVQAEELRGQLGDRMTGAFKLFADAIGVTTAQLDDMLKKGEVIANQDTLGAFGNRLRQIYGPQLGRALQSTTTELGRLQDTLFKSQILVGEGGFVEAFTNGVRKLNEALQSREGRDFFIALGDALTKVTNAIVAVLPYVDELALGLGAIFLRFKVLPFFTGMVTGLKGVTTELVAANASMYTWNATSEMLKAKWYAMSTAALTATAAIKGLNVQNSAAQSAAVFAGRGAVAFSVALRGLQGVIGITVGLARTLVATLGGIPGILLTIGTIAVTSWMGELGSTNSALDEHKRIMDTVLNKYDEVKDKTDAWKTSLKSVSLAQLDKNVLDLREAMRAAKDELESIKPEGLFYSAPMSQRGVLVEITKLKDAYSANAISAAQFKSELDKLYSSITDDTLRKYAADLQTAADKGSVLERSLGEAATMAKEKGSALSGLNEHIKQTDASLESLTQKTDENSAANNKAADNATKFQSALAEIAKTTGKVSEELDRLGKIDALTKLYNDGIKAAQSMGQVLALTQQYNSALSSVSSGSINGSSDIVSKIIGVESGGRFDAKNPNSSATGAGQFIESTWLRMFKQYFPEMAVTMSDAQIKELRLDPQISRQMVALYAQENAKFLSGAGIQPTDANLYLAHFLGAGGAKNVLSASASTPVNQLLGADQINANQSVLQGKTAGEVVAWAQQKVGISKEEAAIQTRIVEQEQKRVETAKEYNADLNSRLAAQENENANAGRMTQEAYVQRELEKEMKKAKEANVTLDEAQIARIKEVAAQEWDVANAKREQKTEQQGANALLQQAMALYQQRNALQAQLQQQMAIGDVSGADATSIKLQQVNMDLQTAISNARQMWEAIGGPAAETALAKLDTLSVKIQTANNKTNSFGLTGQQITGWVDSFASGIANAFGAAADAVAAGENAFKAFGKAVLQTFASILREISITIIKMTILKALTGMGGGIGSASGGLLKGMGVAHTGGVAGSATRTRSISGAALGAAMVYHTGGVAGLKSDEVVSVLQRGETIRTQAQEEALSERMMLAEKSSSAGGPQTIRNVITLDEDSANNYLTSSGGERAIWSVLSKNRAKLRDLTGG